MYDLTEMDLFLVAVVQAGSVPFDRERSTAKALELTGQAIRDGARLIVFPEAFISGYPKGTDFGTRVGMRSPEGRKWFRTYFESAITVPGPERGRLEKLRKPKSGDGKPTEFRSPNFLGRLYQSTVAGEAGIRDTSTQRLHWRRGHIKSQPHGPHHSLRKII